MSKLAHSNQSTMDEIEMRSMFDPESRIAKAEVFEILNANGIREITWDSTLNREYQHWIYENVK